MVCVGNREKIDREGEWVVGDSESARCVVWLSRITAKLAPYTPVDASVI